MKVMITAALFVTFLDCIQKAMGWESQSLVGENFLWVYWVMAFIWGFHTINFIFFMKVSNIKQT